MNALQKEIGRRLEALGFEFEGYDGKTATVYSLDGSGQRIRVHGTPNNGRGTYSTVDGTLRTARAMVAGKLRSGEAFLDWLCKKYGIGDREAKRVRLQVTDEVRAFLRETKDPRTEATLLGWFSNNARDTGRVARLDMKAAALWEIRGPKWGITKSADAPAPETKGAVKGLVRPGPGTRGGKKGLAARQATKDKARGQSPPPPIAATVTPEPKAKPPDAEPEKSLIAAERDALLAKGWEQVGPHWRHPDLPALGKVWLSVAVEQQRIRDAWTAKPAEPAAPVESEPHGVTTGFDDEPEPRKDVRIEVPVAEVAEAAREALLPAAGGDSDVMALFQKLAGMVQEPVVKRAEEAETLAELRAEALRESLMLLDGIQDVLNTVRKNVQQAIDA